MSTLRFHLNCPDLLGFVITLSTTMLGCVGGQDAPPPPELRSSALGEEWSRVRYLLPRAEHCYGGQPHTPRVVDVCTLLGPWPDALIVWTPTMPPQEVPFACEGSYASPAQQIQAQRLAGLAGTPVPEETTLTFYPRDLEGFDPQPGRTYLGSLIQAHRDLFLTAAVEVEALNDASFPQEPNDDAILDLPNSLTELARQAEQTLDLYEQACRPPAGFSSREDTLRQLTTPRPLPQCGTAPLEVRPGVSARPEPHEGSDTD